MVAYKDMSPAPLKLCHSHLLTCLPLKRTCRDSRLILGWTQLDEIRKYLWRYFVGPSHYKNVSYGFSPKPTSSILFFFFLNEQLLPTLGHRSLCNTGTSGLKYIKVIATPQSERRSLAMSRVVVFRAVGEMCVRKETGDYWTKVSWYLCSCLPPHSTNWPRNIWSSKGTRPLLLTVRSTLAATSLACSWTPLVLRNTQMLGLEEKALSSLRRLLNPLERAPSKTRRAQVDARGGNVLPYQDVAQEVKWEQWLYDSSDSQITCALFCLSCDSPGLPTDCRVEPTVWHPISFQPQFIKYPVCVPF